MWKLLQIWCLDKVFADRLNSSFDNLKIYGCFPSTGRDEKDLWDTTLSQKIAVTFPSLNSYSAGDEG